MDNRVEGATAYVLHARPYRNSSAIVQYFTCKYGLVNAVLRSVSGKNPKNAALTQPYMPLRISWQGKHELKTISSVEEKHKGINLKGDCLLSAFYLNELLCRLLQSHEPFAKIFDGYALSLQQLSESSPTEIEPILRGFEKLLLEELGYGISYTEEALTGALIIPSAHYHFVVEQGFIKIDINSQVSTAQDYMYKGQTILALNQRDYSNQLTRAAAKRVMRQSLGVHLGSKPLQSRNLFLKQREM